MAKILALTINGDITYCTAPPELRGQGRCNHVEHQLDSESPESFIERISEEVKVVDSKTTKGKAITQKEINSFASKIDEIAGEKITLENYNEVISRLSPEQIDQITKISFEAAPSFSLPIEDKNYEDENIKNKLYFASLPEYGIGGNMSSISQMFEKVGKTETLDGPVDISNSYKSGLEPGEYFAKQFAARDAMINKNISTAKPGYTARKLFYAMSDTLVFKDCGGSHVSALSCSMPEGHICEKCARKTKGGEYIKEGDLVGGLVSTNMSEALTQLSMKQMHVGSSKVTEQQNDSNVIMNTLDAWSSSPIIQKMKSATTTREMREILFNGLKEQYNNAGIEQDDFNIMMVARKLTSYKRVPGGLVPVKDNERCDIINMQAIGNFNNIFKKAELVYGYRDLTTPKKQRLEKDAANQILN